MLPRSPEDWTDKAEWDRYWREWLEIDSSSLKFRLFPSDSFLYLRMLDDFRARGITKILFPGNGISQLPKAFAHLGFDVIALDICDAATAYAHQFEFTDEHLSLLLRRAGKTQNQALAHFDLRSQGYFQYITGDFFDPRVAPDPFDLIISSRTLQGFSTDSVLLKKAVNAFDRRLSYNGFMINLVQNSHEAATVIKNILQEMDYSDFELRSNKRGKISWVPVAG